MNTPSITFNKSSGLPQSRFWFIAFGALLLCAGAVQAAEFKQTAAENPLDRHNSKPYGSGYEARGLGEGQSSDADMTLLPPKQTAGKNSAGSGMTAAGSSGGGSGSGGSGGSGSGSGSGGNGGGGRNR